MASRKHIRWTDETFKERIKELHPNIEVVGKYEGSQNRILCRCKIHSCYWNPIASSLLGKSGCPECGKEKIKIKKRLSNDEFLKKLNEVFPTILPLEEYINSHTPIRFKCLECKNEFTRSPNNLFNSTGCECKQKGWVIIGVNDFKTKCPDLVEILLNKSDAEKYSFCSSQEVDTKCPICGHVRKTKLCYLSSNGFNCPVCGDGVSFTNKFGRMFVEQLPVEKIQHEWTLKIPKHKYRYDTYFEYKNQKYAIEFDGIQHYEDIGRNDFKDQQERDAIKDKYAQENNIILIRIDCRESKSEYIKNSLLNSDLNKLFDLSCINWEECNSKALKSITKLVCDKYNSTKMSIKELSEEFHLSKSTIENRLRIGTNIGITDYYSEENIKIRKSNGGKKTAKILGKEMIAFYPDGSIYGIYESSSECARKMTEDIGKNFNRKSILNVCNHKVSSNRYNGFKYMFLEEYNSIKNKTS